MHKHLRTSTIIAALLASACAFAQSPETSDDDAVIAQLRSTLAARYPKLSIESIAPAPIAGLYEVIAGNRIGYADPGGEYLLMGNLYRTSSGRNLTADRWEAFNAIDFDLLPLERAIVSVRGNGARKIAVFADPDCPYCQELEVELDKMTDLTVYNFLYPLSSIHPDAPRKARAIWCSSDRTAAWQDWMLKKELPDAGKCADDPIAELGELARSLRINSTPTIFLSNGVRVAGTATKAQLEELLLNMRERKLAAQAPALASD